MKDNILCFAAALLLLISCGNREDTVKLFAEDRDVKAEYIEIGQMLQMCNIAMLEDYIVLQNSSEAVDDFFFVYSRPGMDFLYSFGKRGRGPEEYMLPAIIKNTEGNLLGFRDHATDKVAFYELGRSSAVLDNSFVFKSPDSDRFFWEINYIDDSLCLLKHQGYKKGYTELWNTYEKRMEDVLPNTFGRLSRKLGKRYYTIFDDYMISANRKNFIRAYFMIDRIETGKVEDGKICFISAVGDTSAPDFHLYRKNETTEYNVDKNIIYYENIYAGAEYFYALYSGDRLDNTENSHSSLMEIYSWDCAPVSLLHLDVPVSCFAVDETDRTIYALNPDLYEDKILKFRY